MNIFNVVFALTLTCVLSMFASEISNNQNKSPIPGAVPSPEWNWGMYTNGICGEVAVNWDNGRDKSPIIAVSVVNTNVYSFLGGKVNEDALDAASILQRMYFDKFLYFKPTNSFCGVIQLQDATGQILRLQKPDLSSMNSYPTSFSLGAVTSNVPPQSILFSDALHSWHDSLVRFQLGDYFKISKSGSYQLTVWPKIYKRASTNDDICQRIDLPPVTVTIKWAGTTNN